MGGLLEGAAAAVTNVAGSEGTTQLSQSCQLQVCRIFRFTADLVHVTSGASNVSHDDAPARQSIKVAGASRRLGGVPTPPKQEVESAFAKYGPAVRACGCVSVPLCLGERVSKNTLNLELCQREGVLCLCCLRLGYD